MLVDLALMKPFQGYEIVVQNESGQEPMAQDIGLSHCRDLNITLTVSALFCIFTGFYLQLAINKILKYFPMLPCEMFC